VLLRARRLPPALDAVEARHRLRVLTQGGIALALLALVVFLGFFPRTVRSAPRPPVLRASLISVPGLGGSADPAPVTALEAGPVPLTIVAPPVTAEDLVAAADGTQAVLAALEVARGSGASEGLEPGREQEQLPLFYRYVVQEGDTVSTIARHFGIDASYIVWNNIDILPDEDLLAVGEQLQIPSVAGIIHDVRVDETLIEIAELYEAEVDDILAFAANDVANPDLLREGTTILVPGGRVVPPPAPAIRPTLQLAPPPAVVAGEASEFGFVWPVVDLITSYYGPYHPLGIDINAPIGVPIVAAAAGQVVFVGGDACCSYGFHVEIKHDETFSTLYAHLSGYAVELGAFVEQGQVIGFSGNTGRSTGPHLHFEVRREKAQQDPLLYLP
jgi:murein DD-endopeptidase MepM/ murein hydrolase activator NlpD